MFNYYYDQNGQFADDTTVIGLISGEHESAYRDNVQKLAVWCSDNTLHCGRQESRPKGHQPAPATSAGPITS